MTTKVTIDAHAGWPVRVTRIELDADGNPARESETMVPAHSQQGFYIHSHLELRIKEMPSAAP